MLRVLSCVVFSCAIVLSIALDVRASTEAPKIHVFSCQVVSGDPVVPQKDEIGLAVRFQNESPSELASIVWRANYGKSAVDFVDDGTFSPTVQIDNYLLFERGTTRFDWLAALGDVAVVRAHGKPSFSLTKTDVTLPLFVGSENPENCSIVRIVTKSGATWFNPDLPQPAAVLPLPTTPPAPRASVAAVDPIDVGRCLLSVGGKAYLQVSFRSRAERTADRIVIRAAYLNSGIDFTDRGVFARDALISHTLKESLPDGLRKRQYSGLDDSSNCAVVSIHYTDDSTWNNPAVSASPAAFQTPVPNALVFGTNVRWQRHAMPTPLPSSTPSF